ncbi:MAG: hypothetical protein ACI4PI_03610 [Oscillospiraceae bacterium]
MKITQNKLKNICVLNAAAFIIFGVVAGTKDHETLYYIWLLFSAIEMSGEAYTAFRQDKPRKGPLFIYILLAAVIDMFLLFEFYCFIAKLLK